MDYARRPKHDSTPQRSRALYFLAPRRLELREEELRKGEGELLVTSALMGISHGTEMLFYRGELPDGLSADSTIEALAGTLSYPLKYGYSNVGITEEGRRVFAFFPHQEFFYARSDRLIELPDELAFEDALFLPNLETALTILHDASPLIGEYVLILGQGVVGLLVAELLRGMRLGKVLAVDAFPARRAASEAAGTAAFDPHEPRLRERIFEVTRGRGADLAINVSGRSEGLQLAIDTLAFGATVVEASWYGSRTVHLGLGAEFHRKRLVIRSCQVSSIAPSLTGRWNQRRRIDFALEQLLAIRPGRYISHRLPLERAAEAYELIANHPEETIQVVLEP